MKRQISLLILLSLIGKQFAGTAHKPSFIKYLQKPHLLKYE